MIGTDKFITGKLYINQKNNKNNNNYYNVYFSDKMTLFIHLYDNNPAVFYVGPPYQNRHEYNNDFVIKTSNTDKQIHDLRQFFWHSTFFSIHDDYWWNMPVSFNKKNQVHQIKINLKKDGKYRYNTYLIQDLKIDKTISGGKELNITPSTTASEIAEQLKLPKDLQTKIRQSEEDAIKLDKERKPTNVAINNKIQFETTENTKDNSCSFCGINLNCCNFFGKKNKII